MAFLKGMSDSANKVPNGLGRIIDCMKECYLKIRNEILPMSIGYTSDYLGLVACFIILFYLLICYNLYIICYYIGMILQ